MMAQTYMQAAAEVARLAGDCALGFFATEILIEAKSDGSPVTIADKSAERVARAWIEERFPGDGISGEEFGERIETGKHRWIIDPIDGTKSFIRGVPLWGTLVAVADGERVIAGAAFFPALAELIVAAPGEGCWWKDRRCSVSSVADLATALVLTSELPFVGEAARGWEELSSRVAQTRTWGDSYGYLLVATGRAEVMVDPVACEWDIAPFLPIISEAGGVFSDWYGAITPRGGNAIATNSALAVEARDILGAKIGERE